MQRRAFLVTLVGTAASSLVPSYSQSGRSDRGRFLARVAPLDLPQPSKDKVPVYTGTQVTVTGADPTGATNSSTAFEAASATLSANSGGTLIVPPGTYMLGRQIINGGFRRGYARGVPSIKIHGCTNKVILDIRNCTFVCDPSLKFGGFHPETGQPYGITTFTIGAHPAPYQWWDFAASPGNTVEITRNREVEVWGSGPATTVFDGNIESMTIGGLFHTNGDGGRQVPHYGLWIHENQSFKLFNGATCKHYGTDGVSYGWPNMTPSTPLKYHYFENIHGHENGRLGMSWIGGNHGEFVWCDFRRNAMTQYTGGSASPPVSGFDIENEVTNSVRYGIGTLTNGKFTRCIFSDNFGAGLISASGQDRTHMTFNFCTFDAGRGEASVTPSARYWKFNHCLMVGAQHGLISPADMVANGGQGIPAEQAEFNDCVFSSWARDSLLPGLLEWNSTGRTPGAPAVAGRTTFAVPPAFQGASSSWGKFTRCTFDTDVWSLGEKTDPGQTCSYTDCTFKGHQGGTPHHGKFYGINDFQWTNPVPGWGSINPNIEGQNYGIIKFNGVQIAP